MTSKKAVERMTSCIFQITPSPYFCIKIWTSISDLPPSKVFVKNFFFGKSMAQKYPTNLQFVKQESLTLKTIPQLVCLWDCLWVSYLISNNVVVYQQELVITKQLWSYQINNIQASMCFIPFGWGYTCFLE